MPKTLAVILVVWSAIAVADAPKKPSPADQNKALILRFYDEAWNHGQLGVVDEVFANDYVRHDAGPPAAPGPDGQKQVAAGLRRAFPDLVMTIDFAMADGDRVAARWTITGTNTGELPGVKATGKKVVFSGINVYRFDHGKVVELWNHRDDLSLMTQLGVIPKPPTPPKKP